MAISKSKYLWKIRSKHARDIIFGSDEVLSQAADEYFEWCDKHPLYKQEVIKSGQAQGTIVDVPVLRPYSFSGLFAYLRCNRRFFNEFKKSCSDNFGEVIDRIENIIETQQFEGLSLGLFGSSAISRKMDSQSAEETVSANNCTINIEVVDSKTKKELEELHRKMKK